MNLTLKQFRYFEALVRHGHFGRAAEASAISQPALSMQLKELEKSLGIDLFEKNGRTVRLTRFGEDIALRVRDILQSVDELENLARASQHGLTGRLRVGVIPTIAPYLLPDFLCDLAREYDGLEVNVRELLTSQLLSELNEGRLDAAIVALPLSVPGVTEIELFSEHFVLVRPAADALKPVPAPEELGDMGLLLLDDGHCFRDQALSFCKMTRFTPRKLLDAGSLSTLVQMVAAGLGVTLVPEMAVTVETRSAAVAITHFENPAPSRMIGMIWREGSALEAQLLQIADIVRASAHKQKERSNLIAA